MTSNRTNQSALPRPAYLFVLPWSLAHTGGVNQVVRALATEMIRVGDFDPIVLSCDWSAKKPVWGMDNGIKTIRWRVRHYSPDMNLKEQIIFSVWSKYFRRAFGRFCKRYRVQAINLHYPVATALTLDRLIANKTIPIIFSFHGTDVTQLSHASSTVKQAWRRLLTDFDRTVACSNDLAARLQRALNTACSVRVVYNGVDAHSFRALANKARLHRNKRAILNVGKFDKNKGQECLINAFSQLASKYPALELILAGSNGDELTHLMQLCKEKALETRVRFFVDVPHDEMPKLFSSATVFCLASRQEGFPLAVLEAATFALPVVATSVGGIPEIISSGIDGVLVKPDSVEELAKTIAFFLDNSGIAREMGVRLQEKVEANFCWKLAYEKYISLLTASDEDSMAIAAGTPLLAAD